MCPSTSGIRSPPSQTGHFALGSVGTSLAAILTVISLGAAEPRIDHIDRFLTNQVLIHFDTEPNRTYQLQFADNIRPPTNAVAWSNLFVAPRTPFPNHFIIVDTGTNQCRTYRLKVTP
jgi:hypothetical protein